MTDRQRVDELVNKTAVDIVSLIKLETVRFFLSEFSFNVVTL